MKILEAELKNFGNFVDEKLSFHDGINVVWAKNGAGKSTIHEFILAMFYGLKGEECIRWQSWNGNGCLSGKLRFESGGKKLIFWRGISWTARIKAIFIVRRMIRSFPWRRIFRSFLET